MVQGGWRKGEKWQRSKILYLRALDPYAVNKKIGVWIGALGRAGANQIGGKRGEGSGGGRHHSSSIVGAEEVGRPSRGYHWIALVEYPLPTNFGLNLRPRDGERTGDA